MSGDRAMGTTELVAVYGEDLRLVVVERGVECGNRRAGVGSRAQRMAQGA